MAILIVGNGEYARMLCRYLKLTHDIEVAGFTVPGQIASDRMIDGKPVIPAESVADLYDPEENRLIMGIGYRNMNNIKEQEYSRYKAIGYCFDNYIHPTAIIEKDVVLGEANNIFEGVIIQSGVRIGNANLIYAGAMIAHETIIGDYNSVSVKACIAGCVRIGNNCFIGANSTVRDHIDIASYTLAGAGAYVDKDSQQYSVIASQKSCVLEGKSSLEFI